MLHETLPGFLLHKKKIPTSVYNACIQADPRTIKSQNILLDSGYLDEEKLERYTSSLNLSLLEACLTWNTATFRFVTTPSSRAIKSRIEINLIRLIAGWMLRWFELDALRQRLDTILPAKFSLSPIGIFHRQMIQEDIVLLPDLEFSPETSIELVEVPEEPTHIAWLLAAFDLGLFVTHNTVLSFKETSSDLLLSIEHDLNSLSQATDYSIDSFGQDDFPITLQDVNTSAHIGTSNHTTLLRYLQEEWQRLSNAPSAHSTLGVPANASPSLIRAMFQKQTRFFQPEHFDFTDDPETLITLRNCRRVLKGAVRALLPNTTNYSSRSSSSHRFISQDPNWEEDILALAGLFFLDGLTYLKLSQNPLALEHFQEAHDRHPRNANYLAYIGWTQFRLAEYPQALHEAKLTIRAAQRLNPALDTPYTMLGHIARREKQNETARALYLQALEINPESHDARSGLIKLTRASSSESSSVHQAHHTPTRLPAISKRDSPQNARSKPDQTIPE